MDNPFAPLLTEVNKRIDEIKHDVRVSVETAILRESVKFQLSRLLTLDLTDSHAYQTALDALGE